MTIKNKILCVLLLILMAYVSSLLTCPPDSYKDDDDYWPGKEYSNDKESLRGYLFRYVMRDDQYDDQRSGLSYTGVTTLCYRHNVRKPTSNFNTFDMFTPTPAPKLITQFPGIDSHLTSIWDSLCRTPRFRFFQRTLHLPINFHAYNEDTEYILKIRIANPTTRVANYHFQLYRQFYTEINLPPLPSLLYETEVKEITSTSKSLDGKTGEIVTIIFKVNIGRKELTANGENFESYYLNENTAPWTIAYQDSDDRPNLDLQLVSDRELGIATVEMTHIRPNQAETSYCGNKSCQDTCPCIENYFCGASEKCAKCQPHCNSCSSGGDNICTSCFQTSTEWNKLPSSSNKKCVFDFMDITKHKLPLELDVPPAIHWRFTIEFWTFIHYPKRLVENFDIIYKDFLSFSMTKKSDTEIIMYCVPIEWLYPIDDKEETVIIKDHLEIIKGAFFLSEEKFAAAEWIYTRCAFNFDNNKSYMDDQNETELAIPQMYVDQTNYPWQLKKFYKKNDKVKFIIQYPKQDEAVAKPNNIYLRNINIYREYIPQSIQTKYFNVHKLNLHNQFPQLLFSIPFDDVTPPSPYTFTWYDFFDRETDGIVGDQKITNTQTIALVDTNLVPGRLFKRLNFLNVNTQYNGASNCELLSTIPISCSESLCFENDKPYVCNEDKYLTKNLVCDTKCPSGMMHHPDDNNYQKRNYCTSSCDYNAQLCPDTPLYYQDIKVFSCKNNFFEIYYKCYPDEVQFNKGNALQFSKDLNTHTIIIDLKASYNSFVLEAWIYPDIRFSVPRADPPLTDTIFMTNLFRIDAEPTQRFNIARLANPTAHTETIEVDDNYQNLNWNHFIFSSDYRAVAGNTEYYISFRHNIYNYSYKTGGHVFHYRGGTIRNGARALTQILFCNRDQETSALCDVDWINAYYRNIRIWDVTHSSRYAIFNSLQFENSRNMMIKHQFKMYLEDLAKNKIKDSVGSSESNVPFVAKANQNPDNESMFNYESFFALDEYEVANYIITWTWSKKQISPDTNDSCGTGCSKCYTKDECLSCLEGYSLYAKTCKPSKYFYKNPSKNMPQRLALKIKDISTEKYVTFFFFIKLYGFTQTVVNPEDRILIIFDDVNNLLLAYNPDFDGTLEIQYNGVVHFDYREFNRDNMGHWIPISIAAFRQYDTTFTQSMTQASIKYTNLLHLDPAFLRTSYSLNQFIITNTWIGLLADLRIYNYFIPNAWGRVKYDSYDMINKLQFQSIPFQSIQKDQCLQASEIGTSASGVIIQCFNDYNPHWECNINKNNNYLHWDQGVLDGYCGGDCGSVYKNDCLGNDNTITGSIYRYDNQVCDNRIIDWSSMILQYNGNHVICRELLFVDFARFKKGTIGNIDSPPVVFSIDFWFYYQVYEIESNFKSITFIWDFHIKIEMELVFNSEAGMNRNELIARCYPVIDKSKPANDPTPNKINFGQSRQGNWIYISCGVNDSGKTTYLTNVNKFQNEIIYAKTNNLIPSGTVTFSFFESSKSGYGLLQIRELRLWKCYSCSPAFRNFAWQSSTDFSSVLHRFSTESGDGLLVDSIKEGVRVRLVDEIEFEGYNILNDWWSPLWCNENDYYYYRDGNTGCDQMFNLARLQDFKFSIPSSRTSRYTIGFWFFIESAQEMTKGMNIIWDNHMSISLIRDSTQSETIVAVCFPQAYRDKVDGKVGLEIFDLYNTAVNKDKFDFTTASSKWNFVQCGVDLTRKVMYVNDQGDADYPETELLGELLYGDVRNYRPFRYFTITEKTPMRFQNAKENLTRIFFRSFRAYIDFIPQQIKKIKFFNLRKYVGIFWPLVLYIDFNDYTRWNCVNCIGLHWYSTEPDGVTGILRYLPTFLNGRLPLIYTTYPDYYVQAICNSGQGGGDNQPCTGGECNFCYHDSSTQFFYPPNDSNYLDLTTLKQVNNCRGYTRMPDANINKGFCLLYCSDVEAKINTCAETQASWGYGAYSNKFSCVPNYSRVYYECLDDSLVKESAMYFSNYFSFNNIVIDHPKKVKSYYFEVWFKLDMINFGNKITKKLYYLLAPPHLIIHDPVDQLFKYANTKISSGTFFYQLTLEYYEWNRIIIRTYYDEVTKNYSIDLYLNYNFVNPEVSIKNLDGTIYDMTFQGIAFCNQPFANCQLNSVTYNTEWGTAWYKNLRLWEEKTSSLELIQTCEVGYTQLLKSQLLYFDFSINTVSENKIRDKFGWTMSCKFWYHGSFYDNDTRENTSVNTFDLSYLNPGKYINGITEEGDNYILLSCSIQCKRCYSSGSTNCYECENGYVLSGKECKPVTNYYLKTPPKLPMANIEILTNTPDLNLSTQNPITITVWMKFFGITSNAPPIITYHPIITFFNTTSFIGYNINDNTFVVVINSNVEIFSVNAKPYIGKWSHFGLSIHRSDSANYPIFPHMVNFMINQQVFNPIVTATFEPETTEITIDRLFISTTPIAYYFSLSFYKNYWFGTYGHINGVSSTQGVDLIHQVNLAGTSINTCIVGGELVTSIDPICVADYNPYDDNLNQCSNDFKYIDLTLPNSPPCGSCNSLCLTQCYHSNKKSCSSNYKEGLYWIATQEHPIVDYYSQKIDNINFANYAPIKIQNLQMVKNDEMSLEFWVYIYQYKPSTFLSFDIIWDKHVRIAFVRSGTSINAFCYPYADVNALGAFTENMFKTIAFKQWHYLRCAADRFRTHLKYYLSGIPQQTIATAIPIYSQSISSLTIRDNTLNLSYGFSFIRELKLFSSYPFDFWLPDEHNLTPNLYSYLLHYFTNKFDQTDITKAELFDKIQEYSFPLTLKTGLIGYNYVKGYNYITQCNEGYVWDAVNKQCAIYNIPTCLVAKDATGKCLLCANPNPYLDYDNTCSKDCGPNSKYPDDKLMQCRNCDVTCFTCNGKEFNKCLSCAPPYFFVPDLRTCVLNCQDYGLTPSVGIPMNTCVPFTAEARILNYDITKPIFQAGFNLIEGQVYDNTAIPIDVKWEFNRLETVNINQDHRNFGSLVIPLGNPFTGGDLSQIVSVDPDFFMIGFKYVFNLWIYNINGSSRAHVMRTFVFIMNDYPILGKFNVLPNKGYLSHNFLITCNKCTDDNTDKADLLYEFTYMTAKDDKTTEVILQAYSPVSEIFHQFTTVNTNNEYYLYCYCKDIMGIIEHDVYSLGVYDIPNNSGEDISVSDMIGSNDFDEILTPEQLGNRAEFLYSMTIDFPNPFVLARTTVSSPSGSPSLSLDDPTGQFQDIYCNKRGHSYVIDKYLFCDCQNYNGKNCQIDGLSYKSLLKTYILLYTKIKEAQTAQFNAFLLNGIHKLLKSACFFMNNDNMNFMLQGIDYIVMFIQNFPEEMMKNNNHEKFLDIYNSLVEYGLLLINTFKISNFIEINSKLPTGLYDADLVRICTMKDHQIAFMKSYFDRVKTSLKSTMKFYVDNKFTVSFRNTNINLYITLINENFSFDAFFSSEKSNYEPYFDVSNCLGSVMKNSYSVNTYKIFLSAVIWKVSPYLSEDHLYLNNTTPMIEIDFYDFVSFKQIYLTNCGIDSDVELYFPVDSYAMPERVNDKRKYVSPEMQYDMSHDIFNDPVYIDLKGEVFNSTPSERISEYFVPFNFSCTYYESDSNSLSIKGCDYSNFTALNYIQCKCIHLTDFVAEKYEVLGDFTINTRFFYLKHYMLLAFRGNYDHNPILYIYIALVGIYILVIVIYTICDCYIINRKSLLSYLKTSIVKINLPYRENYVFSEDIHLDPEIRQRLEGGKNRNPDVIENNIGINNIDVMIMADNIARYDRKYDENKEELKDQGDFFNSKNPEKTTDAQGKFFRKNKNDSEGTLVADAETKQYEDEDSKQVSQSKGFFPKQNKPSGSSNKKGGIFGRKFDDDFDEENSKGGPGGLAAPPQKKKSKGKGEGEEKKPEEDNDNVNYNLENNDDNEQDINPKHKKKKTVAKNLNYFEKEDTRIKQVNPFQEMYTHYNPSFAKPKVISKKLDFYDKDYIKSEKSALITEDSKKKTNSIKSKVNKEAEIRVNYTENQTEMETNLTSSKEELPKLPVILTKERRLLEFNRLDLDYWNYFKKNIKNRYILNSTFANFSICYGRFKRIGNFIAQIALYTLFFSVLFTADAKMDVFIGRSGYSLGMLILYCFIAEIGSCLLIHLPSFFFYIDVKHFRLVYDTIRENRGLEIMKDWEKVTSGKFWWNLLGIVTQWLYILISFYFSFGFCATYAYQAVTFFLAILSTIILDWLILEFVWEAIIGLFYSLRGMGRCTIVIAEFLNRTRAMKTLT